MWVRINQLQTWLMYFKNVLPTSLQVITQYKLCLTYSIIISYSDTLLHIYSKKRIKKHLAEYHNS